MADYNIPDDLRYTETHEWVRVEGNEAVIGVTDYAQKHLGDITFVDLPEVDDEFNKTEEIGAVESVKAASDVYSPIGGKVKEINETLEETPELLNQDCYGEGWMIRLVLSDETELDKLMDAERYAEHCEKDEH